MGEERILLVENTDVITSDEQIATIFNNYFNTITNSLNLKSWSSQPVLQGATNNKIEAAIENVSRHPSI